MSLSLSAVRGKRQRGFTLIELVVVIVILGILAAFAIPRFINIAQNARISALNGMAGTLRSTAALVHGMALATNAVATVSLEGQSIDIVNSYPAASATGIQAAMNNTQGFTMTGPAGTPPVVTFQVIGAPNQATCSVTYTEPAAANTSAIVGAPVTAGC